MRWLSTCVRVYLSRTNEHSCSGIKCFCISVHVQTYTYNVSACVRDDVYRLLSSRLTPLRAFILISTFLFSIFFFLFFHFCLIASYFSFLKSRRRNREDRRCISLSIHIYFFSVLLGLQRD